MEMSPKLNGTRDRACDLHKDKGREGWWSRTLEKKAEGCAETNIISPRLGVKRVVDFHPKMAFSCHHGWRTVWNCDYWTQRLGGAALS